MSLIVTPTRRKVLTGGALLGGLALAGCDRLSMAPDFTHFLGTGEVLTKATQRFLLTDQPLAREFSAADRSPVFKVNGSASVGDPRYKEMAAQGFASYRLEVGGMVRYPLHLSLAQLREMPARTQITRHDCVEGWSAIGKWQGVQLARLLQMAGLARRVRFIVFYCADSLDPAAGANGQYYESIDLFDAFHPQTILAYDLNDAPLSVGHGAPLRLRVERQLGYKQAKFVMRIEAVERLDDLFQGRGGFWEDRGYQWYAGI